MSDGSRSEETRRRPRGTLRISALLLAVVGLVAAAAVFRAAVTGAGDAVRDLTDFELTETRVTQAVEATLQREVPQRFLVTGRLDVVARTEVENTRTMLPGLLDLSLGTSRATVRVPGRVFYGIDLRDFGAADVSLGRDSVVVVRLQAPKVGSVEPLLEELEVETERGWARMPARSDREAERRAVQLVSPALRSQGRARLADSLQPRLNTARAVAALLTPALRAAGLPDPVVRVHVGEAEFTVPSG